MFPQIFGKYVLEKELAKGGMARVYLAMLRGAVGFEKRLVVKQIRPELANDPAFVRRFVEEAKTTVELSHPNIVPVYELGVEQGVYYIAMEYCPGVTLSEVLAKTGKLSPEEGAYVGVEICRALDYAHRRAGIVHRDVTPRNVLLDEEGAIRLIDFGIASPVSGAKVGRGEIFGSRGHMPPEQVAGKALSPATDVFAVAVLLVEAWTGKPPFRRATAEECNEALNTPLVPLAQQDPGLAPVSDIVMRGLALKVSERPAEAEIFSRPLRDFLRNVDSGDVARRLGERVRQAMRTEKPKEAIPSAAPPDGNDRRSRDTHTFAARNEVSQWTRRMQSSPSVRLPLRDNGGSATRKLPSFPDGVEGDGRPSNHLRIGRRDSWGGPATRKLPSIPPEGGEPEGVWEPVDVRPSQQLRVAQPVTRKLPSIPPGGVDSEAVWESVDAGARSSQQLRAAGPATRKLPSFPPDSSSRGTLLPAPPLQLAKGADVVVERPSLSIPPAPPTTILRRAKVMRWLGPTVLGAAGVAWLWKGIEWGSEHGRGLAQASRGVVSERQLAASPEATVASARPEAPVASAPSMVASASASPSASVNAETRAAPGRLRVTADPSAAVSVAGKGASRAGVTPLRDLRLPPGRYTVTLKNKTYGTPIVARVNVESGSDRSVYVDFREAEPRVLIR
ncbi:MAG TPA: serine/threonine-protein kinase [Polyangiaceae bacterium]|nr:serine/threonine-protein kinase [Polyangiaceae bacterium]